MAAIASSGGVLLRTVGMWTLHVMSMHPNVDYVQQNGRNRLERRGGRLRTVGVVVLEDELAVAGGVVHRTGLLLPAAAAAAVRKRG